MTEGFVHSFAGGTLNRAALERPKPGFAEAQLESPNAQFVCFVGDRALIDVSRAPAILFSPRLGAVPNSGPVPPIFLGMANDDVPVFAQFVDGDDADSFARPLPDTIKAIDLRSVAGQAIVSTEDLGLLAYARSMLAWHLHHRFCANCGSETAISIGGDRRHCAACDREHFPRTDPVAIMLVHKDGKCLLGRGRNFPEQRYSALAGFIEPGETIEEAARREIHEESGIHVGRVDYHSSQPWPFVSSLMIGLLGEALNIEIVIDEGELADARWFTQAEARSMLDETHPDGYTAPPPLAIAHHLLQSFLKM